MRKSFYVLIRMDDEYGYELFSGIAFTLGSAYSMVKEKLISNELRFKHTGVEFHDWQLVKTDSLDELDETFFDDVRDTEYRIFEFDEQGTKTQSLAVLATESHKGETK